MTVVQTDTIDFVSIEKNTGLVKLTISDHLDWNQENQHLLLLQEKINTYLSFIEGGELYDIYPEAKGKSIVINITYKYNPSEGCLNFLKKAEHIIKEAGFHLAAETLPS